MPNTTVGEFMIRCCVRLPAQAYRGTQGSGTCLLSDIDSVMVLGRSERGFVSDIIRPRWYRFGVGHHLSFLQVGL